MKVHHIYTLENCVPGLPGAPAEDRLNLGRFGLHSSADRGLALRIVGPPEPQLPLVFSDGVEEVKSVARETATLWFDGLGHAQLHVVWDHPDDIAAAARELALFCHGRQGLRIDGRPVATWVGNTWACSEPPALSQDVLQVVEVSDAQAVKMHCAMQGGSPSQDLLRLVYRSPVETFSCVPGSISFPVELNRNVADVGAHGRGVCVLGGHEAHQNEALKLVACRLLFGLARLRGVRRKIEDEFADEADARRPGSAWLDERYLLELTATVREQRVALNFGVEAWIDGLFVPDLVLDDFRRSFQSVLRLDEMSSSTRSLLESLASIAESALQQAQLAATRRVAAQQRRSQLIISIASGITFPFALLLGFFGVTSQVTVPPTSSIFDMQRYGTPWALALAATAIIVVGAYVRFRFENAVAAGEPNTPRTNGSDRMPPMISAHRCGAGDRLELENTEEALRRAVTLDVEFVEFDVQRCADGRFVLFHDDTIEVDGHATTLLDVSSAWLLEHAEQVVRFETALAIVHDGGKRAHVDLKTMGTERIEGLAPGAAAAKQAVGVLGPERVLITTLEDDVVKSVRAWSADAHPGLLVGLSLGRAVPRGALLRLVRTRLSELFPTRRYRRSDATLVVCHERLARVRVARWATRRGLPLLVWTVDDRDDLRRWLRDRDDAYLVTTNHPKLAIETRSARRG